MHLIKCRISEQCINAITLFNEAGEKGKIFGSVNTIQLSEALKAEGLDIDRKSIKIKESLTTIPAKARKPINDKKRNRTK